MAGETLSSNMSLVIPAVGITAGPQYAIDLNSSLQIIDAHNHAPGSGVPITPAGMSITSDLSMISNDLILARSIRFDPQVTALAGISDLGCIYEVGVDLYYNDGNGNQIRLTQSGGVAGTPGSIAGLVAPASVTYTAFNQTFTFQSAALTSGNLDIGSLIIREVAASANGITISSPTSLAASYTLTLPIRLPSLKSVPTVTTGGVMAWSPTYDAIVGSSAQVTAGVADYSTLTAAIAAVSSNGSIKVLRGAWTENIALAKTLNIYGSGYDSVFTGTLTFTNADYCIIQGIRFSGNLTLDSASQGNQITGCYIGASATGTDNGDGNYIELIQG